MRTLTTLFSVLLLAQLAGGSSAWIAGAVLATVLAAAVAYQWARRVPPAAPAARGVAIRELFRRPSVVRLRDPGTAGRRRPRAPAPRVSAA
ncbi:DUF6412 domain-containing protein [Fodinicola acaciae]|uniref:DUF6412 domain-containing protein n=1 Tax=Fodinicola acaciae TaxID=2681555 RepID=UPI0013D51490|nr:DUF6412 domain-containing protein [Fodinicola acaciae]